MAEAGIVGWPRHPPAQPHGRHGLPRLEVWLRVPYAASAAPIRHGVL